MRNINRECECDLDHGSVKFQALTIVNHLSQGTTPPYDPAQIPQTARVILGYLSDSSPGFHLDIGKQTSGSRQQAPCTGQEALDSWLTFPIQKTHSPKSTCIRHLTPLRSFCRRAFRPDQLTFSFLARVAIPVLSSPSREPVHPKIPAHQLRAQLPVDLKRNP